MRSMRRRICETVWRPSVCLSQHGPTASAANLLLKLWSQHAGDMDRLLQQWRANAGSAGFSVYVDADTDLSYEESKNRFCFNISNKLILL